METYYSIQGLKEGVQENFQNVKRQRGHIRENYTFNM